MMPFYATFGTGHAYHGCYIEIFAEDSHAARVHMIREHGERWASLYNAVDFAPQVQKYGLRKLVTVQQRHGYSGTAFFDVTGVAA